MSTEAIQLALNRRFSAPLPEFHRRRIIFWRDEEREFENLIDELAFTDVKLIKLTGSNNFAVKKLLLHDDPTGNYLIYDPLTYPRQQDNWLRDIELYSEEYRADFLSMQMEELNIEPSPQMRQTVRLYAKFLESKDRRQKLKKLGRRYETPLRLHIDIMAVLAGLNGGSAQDVFLAVLTAGVDQETNTVLTNIRKFGSIGAFWQLVRKYTGYIHSEEKDLGDFAAHILLTALSQTMDTGALRGLERFICESGKAYCYGAVHEWRSSGHSQALYRLCRRVEAELDLPARFDKQPTETLLTGDIFPAIHESILKRFYSEISEQVIKTELILKTLETKRTAGWFHRFEHYYDCLYLIARMRQFYESNAAGFHTVEPAQIWKRYTENDYQMDSLYRAFHCAFGEALKSGSPGPEDRLKQAGEYVEALYQNWFLNGLTACWTNAVADDLENLGYISGIGRQRDFYAHYVQPLTDKNSKVFVIVSDALRYEVAAELCARIVQTHNGNARLEAVQSMFPSVTKLGMAALLPGKTISVSDAMEVFVDGAPSRSTLERQKLLRAVNSASVAVQASELLSMKRAERRELSNGKDVIYIYHNTIDAIGDKLSTEKKVFTACGDAIGELNNLLRIILNDMQGNDVFITADHGFLYTHQPLAECDKVSKSIISGKAYEAGRRYVITAPDSQAQSLLPVRLSNTLSGARVVGFTPRDTTRIKLSGGGENYVHGGISLQEMTVPVIVYKNMRATSKNFIEVSDAELTLLSESRKISNLLFSLDFFQKQPVGDKIRPCAYCVYLTDGEGTVVSDKQAVIADRTDNTAADRVFRVRFNLKAGSYDSKKVYRLVIANREETCQELDFHIDIAAADDFGFDL